MRYTDPKLLDLLAREYVLGTLCGAARRRFERLMKSDSAPRRHVRYWEERLSGLAYSLEPIEPRARAWEGIQARLGWTRERREKPTWPGLRSLQALAAALGLAVIVLTGVLLSERAPLEPDYLSVVADADGAAVWAVRVDEERAELDVDVAAPPPALDDDGVYELWMLTDAGEAVSLGVLPFHDAARRRLDPSALNALARSRTLAVSVEPPGGSPTGQPTGPVVFTAPLARI